MTLMSIENSLRGSSDYLSTEHPEWAGQIIALICLIIGNGLEWKGMELSTQLEKLETNSFIIRNHYSSFQSHLVMKSSLIC